MGGRKPTHAREEHANLENEMSKLEFDLEASHCEEKALHATPLCTHLNNYGWDQIKGKLLVYPTVQSFATQKDGITADIWAPLKSNNPLKKALHPLEFSINQIKQNVCY